MIQIARVIDFESWLVGIHKRVFVLTTLRVKLTVITLHFRGLKSPAAGHFDPGQSYFSCHMFAVWNSAALYKCAKVTWLVANWVHEHTAHAQFMHSVPMVPMVIYTFAEEECTFTVLIMSTIRNLCYRFVLISQSFVRHSALHRSNHTLDISIQQYTGPHCLFPMLIRSSGCELLEGACILGIAFNTVRRAEILKTLFCNI